MKKPLPTYNSITKQDLANAFKAISQKPLSGFVGRAGQHFLGGELVRELENRFCRYFKVKYAVSFNSATAALQAAVGALGIGPGDEVITSPTTMCATPSSVLANSALPVFVDIESDTFNINPELVEGLITPKTKAIMVVNLFGGSAKYDAILKIVRKHKLKIIEDNAQSPAATYKGKYCGAIGDIGVFSLNQNKVIHCGEGGVLVTDNKKYALRAQLIRNHGEAVNDDLFSTEKIYEPVLGNNFRLTEIQAAIAIEQFKKLDKLNMARIKLADYLTKRLKQFSFLVPPNILPKSKHVFFVYPIRFLEKNIGISRQVFAKALRAEGFGIGEGYQKPLYLLPMYQRKEIFPNSHFPFISKEYPHNISYKKGICPTAERLFEKELLTTTICQPPQTKKEIDLFVSAISKIEKNVGDLRRASARN